MAMARSTTLARDARRARPYGRAPLRTEEWLTSATACARHYATLALTGLPRTAGVNEFPLGWLVQAQRVVWGIPRGGPPGPRQRKGHAGEASSGS